MAGCWYRPGLLYVAPDHWNTADFVIPAVAGMDYINHWIPRPLVPDLPAAGRRGSTTARLSSPNALHPCRRARAGMTTKSKACI